jgi:hypothetical protein
VRRVLDTAATVTIILRQLATTLGTEPNTKFADQTATICKQILADRQNADLYILQQIRPLDNLCAVVKSDTLTQLGLEKWKVNGGILQIMEGIKLILAEACMLCSKYDLRTLLHPSHTLLTPLSPLTPLSHLSHTPLAPLSHPSRTPRTSRTPLAPFQSNYFVLRYVF